MNRPPDESVPRIANLKGLEQIQLEPEEAFVLSRVNGVSSLTEIGQILSYDAARVWKLLQRSVEAGIVVVGAKARAKSRMAQPKTMLNWIFVEISG